MYKKVLLLLFCYFSLLCYFVCYFLRAKYQHNNITRGFSKVKGLTRGTFAKTNHAVTAGSITTGKTITIFRYGGRALFVVGVGMSAYDVYKAENRSRETVRQVSGWSGALLGARVGAWGGTKTGAAVAGVAGQFGPQVASPEELVTVPVCAIVGGVIGCVGGGAIGWWSGTEVSETVYDWILTPLEKEEWVVCQEE